MATTSDAREVLCYTRDGTLIEDQIESEGDPYSLRRTPAGLRIPVDQVEK